MSEWERGIRDARRDTVESEAATEQHPLRALHAAPHIARVLHRRRQQQRLSKADAGQVAPHTTAQRFGEPKFGAGENEKAKANSADGQQDKDETGETLSGVVPDIRGEGMSKGAEEGAEDRPTASTASASEEGAIAVPELSLDFVQTQRSNAGGAKHDMGSGSLAMSFSQAGGLSVTPFGREDFTPAFTGSSFTFKDGQCHIKSNLEINCPWGTNAGGRKDVPSPTDGMVTAANYEAIRDDLKPDAAAPHKSRRANYYSQSLVERHEKFHGTDDWLWSQGDGVKGVEAMIKARNIGAPTAAADVKQLLEDCRDDLMTRNFAWYQGGGSDHNSYAGEIRAYADGKAEYQRLADGVDAQGKKLKASSAAGAGTAK